MHDIRDPNAERRARGVKSRFDASPPPLAAESRIATPEQYAAEVARLESYAVDAPIRVKGLADLRREYPEFANLHQAGRNLAARAGAKRGRIAETIAQPALATEAGKVAATKNAMAEIIAAGKRVQEHKAGEPDRHLPPEVQAHAWPSFDDAAKAVDDATGADLLNGVGFAILHRVGASEFSEAQAEIIVAKLAAKMKVGVRILRSEIDRARPRDNPDWLKWQSEDGASVTDAVYSDPAVIAALENLNRDFAVVGIEGDVRILREGRTSPKFMGSDAFKLMHANRKLLVPAGKGEFKSVALANLWIEWPRRREYADGVVFEPGVPQLELPTQYNLWRRWPVEADNSGSCNRFLKHLLDNICRENREHYDFVLDWCADVFQNPRKKCGSALVIRGNEGGTGKSTFGEYLVRALGHYATTLTSEKQLTGDFNALHEGKLLIVAEEAFFSGDHRANSALKNMVSSDRIVIERKGLDAFETVNYARYVLISNDDLVVQATLGNNRRWMVLTCGDGAKDDAEYFQALREEMDNGGLAAFVHLLQNRQMKDPTRAWLRRPPVTEGLREQIEAGLTRRDEFFIDAVVRGQIGDAASPFPAIAFSEDGPTTVYTSDLVEAYMHAVQPHGHELKRATAANIRREAERYWATIDEADNRVYDDGGRRRRCIVVAPLPRCRAKLAAMGVKL